MATGSNLLSVLAHYNRHPWLNIDDCSCCPAQEFFVKVIEQNAILGATIISITHTNRIWCLDVQRFNRATEQQSNARYEWVPPVCSEVAVIGSWKPWAGSWFSVVSGSSSVILVSCQPVFSCGLSSFRLPTQEKRVLQASDYMNFSTSNNNSFSTIWMEDDILIIITRTTST